MTSRPPSSTLFPYTTLFRSETEETETILRRCDRLRNVRAVHLLETNEEDLDSACGEVFNTGYLDRKSTRLNSSHSQISYAVFCLQQKNNYRVDLVQLRCCVA